MTEEKPLGEQLEDAPVVDHASDIVTARVAQIDERIEANKAELEELTARRAAYVNKTKR